MESVGLAFSFVAFVWVVLDHFRSRAATAEVFARVGRLDAVEAHVARLLAADEGDNGKALAEKVDALAKDLSNLRSAISLKQSR